MESRLRAAGGDELVAAPHLGRAALLFTERVPAEQPGTGATEPRGRTAAFSRCSLGAGAASWAPHLYTSPVTRKWVSPFLNSSAWCAEV